MASELLRSITNKFLAFLDACTLRINMQVPESDSRSVNELSSATVAGSGWNPSWDTVPRSSSQSQPEGTTETSVHIVLVEDNRADVRLIKDAILLHKLPAKLRVVENGEQAFEFIDAADQGTELCPALLILDLNLPRKSGREVLKHLRQSKTCADVPVLIVTSSGVDRVEMEGLGGTGYFRKPTDYDEFMKVGGLIKSLLELSRSS